MEEDFSRYLDYSQNLIDFNSLVWKYKHDHNLSLKDEVKMAVPKKLKIFKDVLVTMHNLK